MDQKWTTLGGSPTGRGRCAAPLGRLGAVRHFRWGSVSRMATSGVVWIPCRRHFVPLSPSFRFVVAVIWCPCHRHFAPMSPSFGAPRGRCAAPFGRLGAMRLDYIDVFRRFLAVIWVPGRRHLEPFPPQFGSLVAVISCPCRRHFVPLSPSFRSPVAVIWAQGERGFGSTHYPKWRSAPHGQVAQRSFPAAGRPVPESGPLLVQHQI